MLDRVEHAGLTADDVLRADSPWRAYEIWHGVGLLREPSGGWAEAIASRVVVPLGVSVARRDLGWVFLSSQGFLMRRDPDLLLASDGAFVAKARLPRIPSRGFIELAPDFLIEVKSPDETWEATVEKCGVWIANGATVAWAVNPETRMVAVFRADGTSDVVHDTGVASAAPALSDFALRLEDLFVGLE